jgi:hypothetical protein
MAALTITAADVHIVRMFEMLPDGPANEALGAGEAVRVDATTGKYTPGNGTTTTEAAVRGIACNTADYANATITVMKRGILDVGDALDAMSYGAPVYLSDTDGSLDTAAGTVSTLVGFVIPGWGATTADKLLAVNI